MSALSLAQPEVFFEAWSLNYRYNMVNVENGRVAYGNPGNNLFGPSNELSRGNLNFASHSLGLNAETVSAKYFLQASAELPLSVGSDRTDADYKGNTADWLDMRFAAGPSLGRFGIHIGLQAAFLNKQVRHPSSTGYYYSTGNHYLGPQHFDQYRFWQFGVVFNAVYQINDRCGIRATYIPGRIRHKLRYVNGITRDAEVKFYYTFNEARNTGFFLSFRHTGLFFNGMNEADNGSMANSGDHRFPTNIWDQKSFHVGLNLPFRTKSL